MPLKVKSFENPNLIDCYSVNPALIFLKRKILL